MMTDVPAKFHDRHLSGESESATTAGDVVKRNYDYVLTGTSWDERCTVLTDASVSAHMVQVIRPSNLGSSGLRPEHDVQIEDWARRTSEEVRFVDGASEDVDAAFDAVQEAILTLRKELDRPLDILVDLSATVRYVTLGLVALALNDEVARSVDVFYAEALYRDLPSSDGAEVKESTWQAMAVPGLEGDWFPSRARHFLVSAGFHAERAARLAERWDPNRVSVLLPRPALTDEYEERTSRANSAWMQRFNVTEDDSIDAPPTDAITTWSRLASSALLETDSENIYCLLCGSKPHALALTLWALARQTPAVLYVRPDVHREQSATLTGKVWIYRLRDRSILSQSATAPG